jgi:hypothetical protein
MAENTGFLQRLLKRGHRSPPLVEVEKKQGELLLSLVDEYIERMKSRPQPTQEEEELFGKEAPIPTRAQLFAAIANKAGREAVVVKNWLRNEAVMEDKDIVAVGRVLNLSGVEEKQLKSAAGRLCNQIAQVHDLSGREIKPADHAMRPAGQGQGK